MSNVNLSISRANALIYIARILGGQIHQPTLDLAEECLQRGFLDWQVEKDWEFLLKDSAIGFKVPSCVISTSTAVISAPSSGAFDGVNIGITVTVSSGTGSLTAATTVSAYTRNDDGTIATITLSANPTGSGTATLAFSGEIPILAGVSDYNLPTDFYRHYGFRLYGNLKWPLTFVRVRDWNRVTLDQTIPGPIELYTIFNSNSSLSQNKGQYRMRVFRVPAKNDTAKLEYYRRFDPLADPLDMDGAYLYKFLDHCRALVLQTKRGFDEPDLYLSDVRNSMQKAKAKDEDASEDQDVYFKSQMEMGGLIRPTWNNGPFYSDYGY